MDMPELMVMPKPYTVRGPRTSKAPHVATPGLCRTYHRKAAGKLATVPSRGYTGKDMAKSYQFPSGISAPQPTVWIPEMGGGYSPSVIAQWCSSRGLPAPNLSWQSVLGAGNDYSGDPSSADVEVE